MAAKLFLHVSSDQATAAIWRRRRLTSLQQFENNQDGWLAFGNYLHAARGTPARIIVDTLGEDYRFETLPHASARDRAHMADRKLRQLYRATPFSAWALQGSVPGKRREDRYLFCALTDPELLTPWLRVIEQNRTPIAGIHPLPLVTLSLIDRLNLREPNLLIVSRTRAGLRQTFCKNLQFRVSRLTSTRETSEAAENFYAEEVGNTRMYLDALTVTHVDDTVTALILDHDGSLSGLAEAISRGRPNIQCLRLDASQIATRLGVSPETLAESPDALHLHLLATGKAPPDLAPPTVETGFRIYRVKQGVYVAAAACAVGALFWAGANSFRVIQIEEDIQRFARDALRYQSMYAETTAQFPRSPVSAHELRDTVEAAARIRAQLRMPDTMMLVVSRALDALPEIGLQRFDWHYGERAGQLVGGARENPATSVATETQSALQVALVSAEVTGLSGDYRAVLNRIQAFAGRLAESEQVEEVRIVRLPVNISSDTGLTGSTAGDRRADKAEFQLAVRFRPGV